MAALLKSLAKKGGENTNKILAKKPDEDFIPYVCHYDPHTIITKDGELLQTIRITGFGTDSVATDILSLRDTLRDSIVAHVKDTEFAFWFHTFRRKKNVVPKGEFPDFFSQKINESWDKENEWSERYVNELYITIITEGLDTSIGNMNALLRSFSYTTTKNLHQKHLANAHKKLSKVVTSILVDIEEYGAKLLGIADFEGVLYSEPMRFFGKIINLYEERYPLWINDIAADLASHKFAFGDRGLEVFGYNNKNFAAMLSLKEYQEASVEALDRILQLPFEFIISQSFDFNCNKKDLEHYQYQDYLLKVSGDEECRYLSGIANFIDGDTGSPTDYGKLQTTIMIISKNKEDLEKDVKFAMEKFSSLGLVVIREDVFSEHCFWSQLPGNFRYLRRQKVINSYRVGGFAALHNFPSGTMAGNHWGSAVTVLKTVLDTPYFFNFHEKDMGHTFIFGPKKSGKTVLTNFLLAQSRKFNAKIFYFDLNKSAKPFIKALGGSYYSSIFDAQNPEFFQLNPLSLEKNDTNKAFLSEWFQSLVMFAKDRPPKEQIDFIPQIIDKIFADNVTTFHAAVESFNVAETKVIYEKLRIWDSGKLSHIFTAEAEKSWDQIMAFDVTDLIEQKPVLIPIMQYLLHKIEENLDGSPAIIVLDEAWNLIDNPVFTPQIALFMERVRQKNCVVIFVSSDSDAINASDIIFEIKRGISGEIYTANPNPDAYYKSVLELSDDEIDIIKMMEDDERHFIFKHRGDTVIASLNLTKMPEILKILSADDLTLTAAEEIISANKDESGKLADTQEWVPQLFEILQEIQRDQEEARRQALIEAVQAERKRKEDLENGI
jgi:type IV secretion system protein VirB4